MCLVEKKEATLFSQGGTYEQYRRWIGAYPDLFRIQFLCEKKLPLRERLML